MATDGDDFAIRMYGRLVEQEVYRQNHTIRNIEKEAICCGPETRDVDSAYGQIDRLTIFVDLQVRRYR